MVANQPPHGFSREQKIGFIFMLIFAILTVSLGALQLRNTVYGPFVIRASKPNPFTAVASDETARLKSIDTDHDGFNDYDELYAYNTSPYLPDTDSDGISDKAEIDQGTDPLCPEGKDCNQADITTTATTTPFISPLQSNSPTPVDILNQAQPAATTNSSIDWSTVITDPNQLRALILATGKIQPKDLDKVDDATLQKMAEQLFSQQPAPVSSTTSQP